MFGVVFPQPQHLLLALCIDAERDHDRVVAQDGPIDQHDREVTIPEWRGEPAGRGARRTRSRAARPPAPTDCGSEGASAESDAHPACPRSASCPRGSPGDRGRVSSGVRTTRCGPAPSWHRGPVGPRGCTTRSTSSIRANAPSTGRGIRTVAVGGRSTAWRRRDFLTCFVMAVAPSWLVTPSVPHEG